MQHNMDTQTPTDQPKSDEDLLKQPDVVWKRGQDNAGGWSFEPLIRVKPGTNLLEMLDRLRSGTPTKE